MLAVGALVGVALTAEALGSGVALVLVAAVTVAVLLRQLAMTRDPAS